MKIAEALVRVKDLKGKLSELQHKLKIDAKFKQIDESDEVLSIEPEIAAYIGITNELARLKTCIAKTNALSGLTERINEMEQLKGLVAAFIELTRNKQSERTMESFNYGDPAVPMMIHATYNVEEVTAVVNTKRDRIRELDLELQRMNWEVDLVE